MTRAIHFALISLVIQAGCGRDGRLNDLPAPTPGLELGAESYPAARARFRTELIRDRPSGEDGPLVIPPDAVAVEYRSGDLKLKAFASPVGPAAAARPAVLFLHGGFAMGAGHWAMTRPFRDAGYVVLVPSLRGENGQAGRYSLFHDEVGDVLAAADALAARPDVDPSRLYLAGHSVGGTLTLLAALASRRFRAAASFSAAPDLVEYTRGRPERIPFPTDRPAEYRIRSPVAFADGFRCPVRLFYGEDELWLQPATLRTAILARRAGLDVEAIELPGGHDSVNAESITAAIAFFRRY